jgi:hypothetical protein
MIHAIHYEPASIGKNHLSYNEMIHAIHYEPASIGKNPKIDKLELEIIGKLRSYNTNLLQLAKIL